MSETRHELLLAIAFAPPEEVSTSERLKALHMLDVAGPAAPGIWRGATSEDLPLSDAELDRQLDALFVVDVVLALSSRSVVNGVDPVLFPATGAVLRRLIEDAEQRGNADVSRFSDGP